MHSENLLYHLSDAPTPFQCYVDYIGIKAHFTCDLNWTPSFGGKLKPTNLMDRKDARFFHVVSEQFKSRGDVVNLYVSAMLANRRFHISEFDHQDLIASHRERLSRCSRLHDMIDVEVSNCGVFLHGKGIPLKQFLARDRKPLLIQRSKSIGAGSPEFCAILDRYFGFCNQTNDPSWNERAFVYRKYGKLLSVENLKSFLACVDKFTHFFKECI